MLAAEFALAVAPAAVGDHRGEARIDAAGIDRDRAAEARADGADAVGIDGGMLAEKVERIAQILDLLEADDAAELAFALAAAAHVEAQRHVAELAEHPRRRQHVRAFAVRAEAVQHQKRGAALGRPQALGHAQHAMQAQARRLKTDHFFFHVSTLIGSRGLLAICADADGELT